MCTRCKSNQAERYEKKSQSCVNEYNTTIKRRMRLLNQPKRIKLVDNFEMVELSSTIILVDHSIKKDTLISRLNT